MYRAARFLKYLRSGPAILGATMVATSITVPLSAAPTFRRASVASNGTQASMRSYAPAISADGRFVAFKSFASGLAPGSSNGVSQIFVHDRSTGITTRESVSSGGAPGSLHSFHPSLSADGRYLAFDSASTNLVPGTTGWQQVYVRDRTLGVTTVASRSGSGSVGNSNSHTATISADGRFVSFVSDATNLVSADTNGAIDVFTRDLWSGSVTRDSVASNGAQGAGVSSWPAISGDGRYVAFVSSADNLVAGDTGGQDIFVRDRLLGTTTLESVSDAGAQLNSGPAPSISGDGRFVAFRAVGSSYYIRDRLAARTLAISASESVGDAKLSPDGRFLTFSAAGTIVIYDQITGQSTDLVSGSDPAPANNAIAFQTMDSLIADDTNRSVDIYVADGSFAQSGTPAPPTHLAAVASGPSVTLTWNAPAIGGAPATYILEAGSDRDISNLAAFSTGNTQTSFSAAGLGVGSYYVRVRASNASGTSVPSNEAFFNVAPNCPSAPGPPSSLSGAVSGSTVTLTWEAGTAATSYLLLVGSSPGTSDILASDLGSASTSLFATNVAAGSYFVRLHSVNACGQSAVSNQALIIVR